jgi:hypothetical protein
MFPIEALGQMRTAREKPGFKLQRKLQFYKVVPH